MRYMGIDFGERRIGIAVSDENGQFALPEAVVVFDIYSIETIKKICADKKVGEIVIGESKDYGGKDNVVMVKIREFKNALEKEIGLPVHFEPEFMTSMQAERIQGKNKMHDASAAALILQSFLDKKKHEWN